MRCLLTPLVVAISVITMTHPADANNVNVPPPNSDRGQASALTTQPITTTSEAASIIDQADRLQQISESISGKRAQASRRVNPLDFFSDPVTTLERFAQQNQKPQRVDPLEFFKVPALDSSVGVPVTDF